MSISKEDLKAVMGANLRKLRTAHGFATDELAYWMKITPGFLGLIERGRRGLTAHMLMTAARIFNVSVNYFFDGGEALKTEEENYVTSVFNTEDDGVAVFMPVIIFPRKCMNELQRKVRKMKRHAVFDNDRKLELIAELLTELES